PTARRVSSIASRLPGTTSLRFAFPGWQRSSGGSLSLLADLIERRLPGQGHTLTAALLAGGEPSITARQSYALVKLAQIARDDPLTHAWIVEPSGRAEWRTALPETNPLPNRLYRVSCALRTSRRV
ncbi:MAG: hypothetical protein ABW068_17705, partial [Candidatus Thiodiazotropha sp.]